GPTSKTITVALKHLDTVAEPTEYFYVNLGAATNAFVTKSQGVATITDNDVSGSLQFSAATYTIAETGPQATITVTRTGGTASGVTVGYQVDPGSPGTATGGGVDYTLNPGVLTFNSGVTSLTFTVPIVNDTIVEGPETVGLKLVSPGGYGATLGAQQTATLTITDNDVAGAFSFGAATYTGIEGNTILITVKRTGGLASNVTIDY